MTSSPLDSHVATPQELRERLLAESRGPLLVYRDGGGSQGIVVLADGGDRLTIGRAGRDVSLDWDPRVSRLHATLERVGGAWVVVDDGLSRNGTSVNGRRVSGRVRLHDGDVLLVGGVAIAYRDAGDRTIAGGTVTAGGASPAAELTAAQRRVLAALCRPYRDGGFATPASNPEIAAELTVSVEAVRTTMRALFDRFGIGDLPQNRKRAALAEQALRTGAITRRELSSGPEGGSA